MRLKVAILMALIGAGSAHAQKATDALRDSVRQEREAALVVWPPTEQALRDVQLAKKMIESGDLEPAMYFLQGVIQGPHLSQAAALLSDIYYKDGPTKDHKKANALWRRATDLRMAESRAALSDKMRARELIKAGDYARAFRLLSVAHEHFPDYDTARYLGELYAEGRGVPADPVKALELFIKARDLRALDYLCGGESLFTHDPKTSDPERGWAWFKELDTFSGPWSYVPHTRLGLVRYRCYSRTANPDPMVASKYLTDAAYINPSPLRDNSEALKYLPAVKAELQNTYRLYDRSGALQKYAEPAEAGDVAAMVELYHAYSDGRGAPQDRRRAFAWALRAAQRGDGYAQAIVGEAYMGGYAPVEQDYQEAKAWLLKAADRGQWVAAMLLSQMHRDGLGMKPDRQQATAWLRRCADMGGAVCQAPARAADSPLQKAFGQ